MPYSDINTATLLNEEALREHREEWEIEGEFDPESSFVQLRNEGLEPDPLEGQVFKARDLVRPLDSGADLFPTGVKVLDRLLQGGVARGEMIEALSAPGARTSGRSRSFSPWRRWPRVQASRWRSSISVTIWTHKLPSVRGWISSGSSGCALNT